MKSDYRMIKVELNQGIAILTLNNPPVNQLSRSFLVEIRDALMAAFKDDAIKAVILTGTGKNFTGGADITEIQQVTDRDSLLPRVMENNNFLNSIEEGPKPVIVAMNGTGEGISAEEGLKKGCIDEVVPSEALREKALEVAQRFISGKLNHRNRMTRLRKDRLPNAIMKKMMIAYAKDEAAKKGKGYIAPFKAIEAMERGLPDDFEADRG